MADALAQGKVTKEWTVGTLAALERLAALRAARAPPRGTAHPWGAPAGLGFAKGMTKLASQYGAKFKPLSPDSRQARPWHPRRHCQRGRRSTAPARWWSQDPIGSGPIIGFQF